MSSEIAIITGFGIISAIFGYFAFNMRETHEKLSWFFFFLALIFLNFIILSMSKIAEQSASYLGFVKYGYPIIMWATIMIALYIVFGMLGSMFVSMWQSATNWLSGRKGGPKNGGDEDD